MDKQKIISAILEAEKTLESLRQKLNEPEKPQLLATFKVGDVFVNKRNTISIIVMEKLVNGDKFYHICGNDSGNKGYLSSFSDCGKGFTFEQMLDYLNGQIQQGWKFIGNISEKFDLMIKEMMGKVFMIIPFLIQSFGKWYISYHEHYKELKFARYLTEDGWKKACPKYFDCPDEAMKTFQKYNQNPLPVSEEEYLSEIDYRNDYHEMMYKDSFEELKKIMKVFLSDSE